MKPTVVMVFLQPSEELRARRKPVLVFDESVIDEQSEVWMIQCPTADLMVQRPASQRQADSVSNAEMIIDRKEKLIWNVNDLDDK